MFKSKKDQRWWGVEVWTDASVSPSSSDGIACIGIVVKQMSGDVIREFSEYIGRMSSAEAECRAIIRAMQEVRALGVEVICLSCDNPSVVRFFNKDCIQRQQYPIYKEIDKEASGFASVEIKHCKRSGNKQANSLARAALRSYIKQSAETI